MRHAIMTLSLLLLPAACGGQVVGTGRVDASAGSGGTAGEEDASKGTGGTAGTAGTSGSGGAVGTGGAGASAGPGGSGGTLGSGGSAGGPETCGQTLEAYCATHACIMNVPLSSGTTYRYSMVDKYCADPTFATCVTGLSWCRQYKYDSIELGGCTPHLEAFYDRSGTLVMLRVERAQCVGTPIHAGDCYGIGIACHPEAGADANGN